MTAEESQQAWPQESFLDTDEADLSVEEAFFNEKRAQHCLKALRKNRFKGYYAPDRSAAIAQVMELIPPGAKVGVGDSVSTEQIGFFEALEKRANNEIIYAMRKEGKNYFPGSMEKFIDIGIKALDTDVFVTGTNAITMDGKLLSTDQVGNRVAGLIFGPRKVVVVCGINKLVANIEEARERLRQIAAPLVAARHRIKHKSTGMPGCSLSGICNDCRTPQRICCYTVVIEFQAYPRIHVVLVGESLGA